MEEDMFCLGKSCSCCKTSSNTLRTALGESQIGFKQYLSSDFHMGADRQCCWLVLTINKFLCFFSLYRVHKYNTWVCHFRHLITELGWNSINPLKIKKPQCNKGHGTLINSTCVVWIVDSCCFGLLLYEALLRKQIQILQITSCSWSNQLVVVISFIQIAKTDINLKDTIRLVKKCLPPLMLPPAWKPPDCFAAWAGKIQCSAASIYCMF